MRNELLYKALASVFEQEPRIINEGAPAVVTLTTPTVTFDNNVETYLPANNATGGEQYAVCCPFCGDTRYRLYFSHMWNSIIKTDRTTYRCSKHLMRCFNEECVSLRDTGNAEKDAICRRNFEKVCSALDTAMQTAQSFDIDSVRQQAEQDLETMANQVKLPKIRVPIDDKAVPAAILQYWIKERGYSMDTLKQWDVQVGLLDYPMKRGHSTLVQFPFTILPVYQYGQYWWWQGRLTPPDGTLDGALEVDEFGEEYPKYYIPAGAKKSWTLYNLDDAQYYNDVVLVEGITDVWRVGKRAMAMFGKTLSSAQRHVLAARFAKKRIILVPDMNDPDALDQAISNQIALQSQGVFSSVDISMIEQGKDIGSIQRKEEEIWEYILENIRSPEVDMLGGFGVSGIQL
jgi:hypothetical protein